MATEPTVTAHEAAQIERANTANAIPVVFVHGLWLLPSSWDRWVTLFEEAGYVGLTPGWPDDPATVAEARQRRREGARVRQALHIARHTEGGVNP
jgi:hypothetical protein